MVEIGVGQEHAGDGGIARRGGTRLKFRKRVDLRSEIGRRVDQEPLAGFDAEGDGGLGAGRNAAQPGITTIPAGAIPLREAAASRGS